MKIADGARFLLLLLAFGAHAFAHDLSYRVVTDPAESARGTAIEILEYLAAGDLESAAALSNAPHRRLDVLRNFQQSVGEAEFRRLFGRYFAPENRIVMEAAIGKRRLLVWDLGEAGHQLTGQYFIEVDGRFRMDDVPHEERSKLQRVLEETRKRKP